MPELPNVSISAGVGHLSPDGLDGETEPGPGPPGAFPCPPEPGPPGDGFPVSVWKGLVDSLVLWGQGHRLLLVLRGTAPGLWLCRAGVGLGLRGVIPAQCPWFGASLLLSHRFCFSGGQRSPGSPRVSPSLCVRQDAGAAGADEVSDVQPPVQQQHHRAVSGVHPAPGVRTGGNGCWGCCLRAGGRAPRCRGGDS